MMGKPAPSVWIKERTRRRNNNGLGFSGIAVGALAFLLFACAVPVHAANARAPILAGAWYPKDPLILRGLVENLLAKAMPAPGLPTPANPAALAVPHAGYVYSAKTAACAFALAAGKSYDLVVVIAPSHRLAFDGFALPDDRAFATPLGQVPVDEEAAKALMAACPDARVLPEAHSREHAVEIELPFLQVALKGPFKLLPVVMGSQDPANCEKLAAALAGILEGRRALVVASSDLSHFHVKAKARALDERFMGRVAAYDPAGLGADLASGASEACGGGPVITAMLTAKLLGADTAKVLCHADSSDATGDENEVVGYMSAAFFKAESPRAGDSQPAGEGRPSK